MSPMNCLWSPRHGWQDQSDTATPVSDYWPRVTEHCGSSTSLSLAALTHHKRLMKSRRSGLDAQTSTPNTDAFLKVEEPFFI